MIIHVLIAFAVIIAAFAVCICIDYVCALQIDCDHWRNLFWREYHNHDKTIDETPFPTRANRWHDDQEIF